MGKFDANKLKEVIPPAKTRISLRASLEENGVPQTSELVTITYPNGKSDQLLGIGLNGREKWEIQEEGFTERLNGKGEMESQPVPTKFFPRIIAGTFHDPDSKERIWGDSQEELDAVGKLDSAILSQLADVALRLAGWHKGAKEEAGKESGGEAPGA